MDATALQPPVTLLSPQPSAAASRAISLVIHHPLLRPTNVIFCVYGWLWVTNEPWALKSARINSSEVKAAVTAWSTCIWGLPYLPLSGSSYPRDHVTLVHLCHFFELEEEKQSAPSSLEVVKPAQQQSPFLRNSEAILRWVKWQPARHENLLGPKG